MTPIRARSRKPCRESREIESRSVRASSTLKTGVLPRLTTWVRTLDRRSRIGRNDLAHHQVIEEHLNGGQVLLDRLRRPWVLFDIGRDVHGSNGLDVIDVILRPRQKLSAGPCVSLAGVQVPDPGREKLTIYLENDGRLEHAQRREHSGRRPFRPPSCSGPSLARKFLRC
jgi:hypothetical protein